MTATEHREPARLRRHAALVGLIVTGAAVAVVLLSVALHRARQDAAAARADAAAARVEAQAARSAAADSDAAVAGLRQQLGARAQADRDGPDWTIPIPLAPNPPGFRPPPQDARERINLRGVVRAKRNINGITYATITLGSADSVSKGMRFKVIDRNSFLGYLTVDNVEPSESVGHLEGPGLASVRPGTEVRTQW